MSVCVCVPWWGWFHLEVAQHSRMLPRVLCLAACEASRWRMRTSRMNCECLGCNAWWYRSAGMFHQQGLSSSIWTEPPCPSTQDWWPRSKDAFLQYMIGMWTGSGIPDLGHQVVSPSFKLQSSAGCQCNKMVNGHSLDIYVYIYIYTHKKS